MAVLTSSGSFRPAKMLPFSLGFCLLGLFNLGEVSSGGGGGGGGGATLSFVGEIVSSNQRPKMGSLSSSRGGTRGTLNSSSPLDCFFDTERDSLNICDVVVPFFKQVHHYNTVDTSKMLV